MEIAELAALPIFEGLSPAVLEHISGRVRRRRYEAHDVICRAGEPGHALYLIENGMALVVVEHPEGSRVVARLRRGDIFGEMALLTGDPRYASVVAAVPTDLWELDRDECAAVVAEYPSVLTNVSRILTRRLARMNVQEFDTRRRGEAVALIAGRRARPFLSELLAAARAASPRALATVDLRQAPPLGEVDLANRTVAGLLAVLDDLLAGHGMVVAIADAERDDVPLLLEQVDRAIVVADEAEVRALPAVADLLSCSIEIALLTERPRQAPTAINGLRVVRALDPARAAEHVGWLGRHLARAKLGLALGAGGAKGYAHIGVLQVLEEAGFTVDYVGGSSIGAVVGAWLAMGLNAVEIDEMMRRAFTPQTVEAMFSLSFAGTSTGLDVMSEVWRRTTGGRTFDDLRIPLTVMCVDLNTRLPAVLDSGPLDEALAAATALPGFFPAHVRGEQRLVDGLALVPVPSDAVREAGADITVAVNIVSRETLPAWPGDVPVPAAPPRPSPRMLDTLLEMIDLAQVDSSVRNAARADLVITPRFGPATWRDFHLADLFLEAGRAATQEQLSSLRALVRPPVPTRYQQGGLHGAVAAVHI